MNLQKTQEILEGSTKVLVFKNKVSNKGPASKDKNPFYNPSMEQNRDISIVINQWFLKNSKKHVHFLDGLAASGIRGIRFGNELDGDFEVTINDSNQQAFDLIVENISKQKNENITYCNKDFNVLLSENSYDYIDIDPFGSPVYFIDSALRSIQNYGIIACTATDTAALCGTYPNVCFRRYGAVPFYSVVMKEIGIRILLGFLSRQAGIYDKGIYPIISYCTDHYFRVYVQIIKGKGYANSSVKNNMIIKSEELIGIDKPRKDIGPLWMGKIQNKNILNELMEILFKKQLNTKNEIWKLLYLLEEEADAPEFFYTSDSLSSDLKISPPSMEFIINRLKNKGYNVFRTHFNSTGFKTSAPLNIIKEVFKE